MKNCPYCGEVISDAAKKCKHCKSWIVEKEPVKSYRYCPFCYKPVPEYAKKCISCGEWLEDENIELSCGYGFKNPVVMFIFVLTIIITFIGVVLILIYDSYGGKEAPQILFIWLIFAGIFIPLGEYVYLLPSIIAAARRHPQLVPIFIINFIFGETVIGWIGAMIWATTHRIGRHTHW